REEDAEQPQPTTFPHRDDHTSVIGVPVDFPGWLVQACENTLLHRKSEELPTQMCGEIGDAPFTDVHPLGMGSGKNHDPLLREVVVVLLRQQCTGDLCLLAPHDPG